MKVRKKPVVVEARQFTDRPSAFEIASWCGGAVFTYGAKGMTGIQIPTLEGEMVASQGDWIIQGVQGEFYPCKPDIFAATYEPENPATPSPPPEASRCGECGGTGRAPSVWGEDTIKCKCGSGRSGGSK